MKKSFLYRKTLLSRFFTTISLVSKNETKLSISKENFSKKKKQPDTRIPPKSDFKGYVNPETGEIGGPKTDPLIHGDYSFKGRAIDF
ncbi:hypothetical protein PNEG_01321 [Pneumocystis murina B123]|uniref:Succinate dehydrogenase assembly factor 4, mitochondrial n=1 Tax=Pneumocystis murina (strain B123) TaxID=1069680 RepID=M7NPI3_PNEMU|nr:hypothetical protein PNEG_01321 [Pneumocystis murina B123]EMR10618.1 hypothetical protein PNEG_01321 [Pneumocystis murina B123]